ncbi:hypothetical protein CGZ80_11940 [Rhodopirellula sp. MGV]|nr:hypothetical protein CGZ80_11940 [Rhodopirellula sp. MGV]PNY37738.1 hypothetical protein C2E31_06280 [Rhodopirellula baltica]
MCEAFGKRLPESHGIRSIEFRRSVESLTFARGERTTYPPSTLPRDDLRVSIDQSVPEKLINSVAVRLNGDGATLPGCTRLRCDQRHR